MRVQDIMSTGVKTIVRSASADEAWTTMKDARVHHLVVVDDRGKVTGVVSERDLGGSRGGAVRKQACVGDLMTEQPLTAAADLTVRDAANLLRGRSIGCLPVVERGKPVGIITVTDMLELVGRGGLAAPGSTGKTRWKPVHRIARNPRVVTGRA